MSEVGAPVKKFKASEDPEAAREDSVSLLAYQKSCLASRLEEKRQKIKTLTSENNHIKEEINKKQEFLENLNASWSKVNYS